MDWWTLIGFFFRIGEPFLQRAWDEVSFGRMLEASLLLWIIWRKLRPHLEKIENRLAGLETVVGNGFKSGETRFQKIEERIIALEEKKQPKGGINNEKPSFV